MEAIIKQTIHDFLEKLNSPYSDIQVTLEPDTEGTIARVNIQSKEPNLLIGRHGENIMSFQHLIKLLLLNKIKDKITLKLDISSYRKNQEEKVISLAIKKVESVRKFQKPQALPAMSGYLRRLIHLHLAGEEFNDIITESEGTTDYRYIVIKPNV